MIKDLLRKLVDKPQDFGIADFDAFLDHILSEEDVFDAQIAAFLALTTTCIPQSLDLICECARLLLRHSIKPIINSLDKSSFVVADIVGTGGDGFDTFNASTAAGVVVAGCDCGIFVAKHGNRSSSSSCGSADLLEASGCDLSNILPIDSKTKFHFLFAPTYHASMKQLSIVRKQLGFPTIFNLMGPLINPLCPQVMLVGVSRRQDGPIMCQVLHRTGVEKILVVHGEEGLDEISPERPTITWTIDKHGTVVESRIMPSDFGIKPFPIHLVKGGNPAHNSSLFMILLNNEIDENNPISQFVCMNAAALIYTAGKCQTLEHGMAIAWNSIKNGSAKHAFEQYKSYTHSQ